MYNARTVYKSMLFPERVPMYAYNLEVMPGKAHERCSYDSRL
jgi:hypothetical protein